MSHAQKLYYEYNWNSRERKNRPEKLSVEKHVHLISSAFPATMFFVLGLWNASLERQIPIPWLELTHMACSTQRNLNGYKDRGSPGCAYLVEIAWALASNGKECLSVQLNTCEQTYSNCSGQAASEKPLRAPADLPIQERE